MKLILARYVVLVLALWVVGCAHSSKPLEVKLHTLRDQDVQRGNDPMVRHEMLRRLYGAVSMKERREKLGQYYTVIWDLPGYAGTPKEVKFEYMQGSSGSKVKTIRKELAVDALKGKEEFMVVGENYFTNGRVLAWKISLLAAGKIVATEQSYMWE